MLVGIKTSSDSEVTSVRVPAMDGNKQSAAIHLYESVKYPNYIC